MDRQDSDSEEDHSATLLRNKLITLSPEKKKELLSQIIKRRQNQSLLALKKSKKKVQELQKNIEEKKNRSIQKYESQKLEGLALLQFNKIIHFRFTKEKRQQSSTKSQKNEQQSCPICYQLFKSEQLITQPYICIHIFHTTCIEQFYQSTQKPRCPLCREENIQKYKQVQQLEQMHKKIKQKEQKQEFLQNRFKEYLLK